MFRRGRLLRAKWDRGAHLRARARDRWLASIDLHQPSRWKAPQPAPFGRSSTGRYALCFVVFSPLWPQWSLLTVCVIPDDAYACRRGGGALHRGGMHAHVSAVQKISWRRSSLRGTRAPITSDRGRPIAGYHGYRLGSGYGAGAACAHYGGCYRNYGTAACMPPAKSVSMSLMMPPHVTDVEK